MWLDSYKHVSVSEQKFALWLIHVNKLQPQYNIHGTAHSGTRTQNGQIQSHKEHSGSCSCFITQANLDKHVLLSTEKVGNT